MRIDQKTTNHKYSNINFTAFVMVAFIALQILMFNDCLASTGTSMAGPLKAVTDLVSGDLAKIIAVVSIVLGLVASVARFSFAAIASAFGVAITASTGPDLVQSLVTATF